MSRWLPVLRSVVVPLTIVSVVLFVTGLALSFVTPVGGESAALEAVARRRSPALTTAAHVVTRLGDLWVVVLVATVVAVAVRRAPDAAPIRIVLLLVIGGSAVIVSALKLIVARERPTGGLIGTYSAAYPSGHAVRALVVGGLLAWAWHRIVPHRGARAVLLVVTVVVAAAIAASRVYLGVHLPSDVLVGALIGGAWVIAVVHVVVSAARSGPPEGP